MISHQAILSGDGFCYHLVTVIILQILDIDNDSRLSIDFGSVLSICGSNTCIYNNSFSLNVFFLLHPSERDVIKNLGATFRR